MSARLRGEFVSIEWPKFAEFQGLYWRDTPLSANAPANANASVREKEENAPNEPEIACPPVAEWAPEICQKLIESEGCTPAILRVRLEALTTWARSKGIRRTQDSWEATALIAIREKWGSTQAGNGAAARPVDPQRMTGSQILDFLEAEDAEADFINAKEIN
jgi:hypothetical protein